MKKKKVPRVDPKFLKVVNANQKMRDELNDLTVKLAFLNTMNQILGFYQGGPRYYGKTFNIVE